MRTWVVGFLMDEDEPRRVVLIEKNRPEWQKGHLNGVGGKVEPTDVSHRQAMAREFREETGVLVTDWNHFATLHWEEGDVLFFRAFAPRHIIDAIRTVTDETVIRVYVHDLARRTMIGDLKVIPNLLWLVPLAAHRHDTYDLIDVVETGTTMRKPGRLDVHPGSPLAP